nr:glycosyltransferase [Bacillus subtilis]
MRLERGYRFTGYFSIGQFPVPAEVGAASPENRISRFKNHETARVLYPDLIHAHFAMPSGGAAAVVSESAQIPYVLTLHGSDVNVYPHYSKGAFKAFKRAVGSASVVLAVSHKLQEEAKKLSGFDSSVLPIGIQLSRFQENEETKEEIRKRLGLPLDQRLAVYVGTGWSERKAFLNCLKRSNRCRTLLRQSLSGTVPQNRR